MDNADLATEYVDKAMETALRVIDSKKQEDIALAEECDGTCEECGNEIPEERRQLVATNMCVECQAQYEYKNNVHGA